VRKAQQTIINVHEAVGGVRMREEVRFSIMSRLL